MGRKKVYKIRKTTIIPAIKTGEQTLNIDDITKESIRSAMGYLSTFERVYKEKDMMILKHLRNFIDERITTLEKEEKKKKK